MAFPHQCGIIEEKHDNVIRVPFVASDSDIVAVVEPLVVVFALAFLGLDTRAVLHELAGRTLAPGHAFLGARLRHHVVQTLTGSGAGRHAVRVHQTLGTLLGCTEDGHVVRYHHHYMQEQLKCSTIHYIPHIEKWNPAKVTLITDSRYS